MDWFKNLFSGGDSFGGDWGSNWLSDWWGDSSPDASTGYDWGALDQPVYTQPFYDWGALDQMAGVPYGSTYDSGGYGGGYDGYGGGYDWGALDQMAGVPYGATYDGGGYGGGYDGYGGGYDWSSLPISAGGGLFGGFQDLTGMTSGGLLSTGANLFGGYLQGNAGNNAAQTQANAQLEAARIAADAAKFRPVGVSTRFGSSRFGFDNQGNLSSAGYDLSPEMKAQQDRLMNMSDRGLGQYEGAFDATQPMGEAAGRMMSLGNQYLGTSPQEQAQKYMAEQQALLSTGRERDFSQLQNTMFNRGRGGLAMGGTTTGMQAANPQMEAFYNAQRQQDLGLAAQATQGGMDYAKFGSGMVGAGGDMLRDQYKTQTAAYDPYKTALGGATYIEGLGQNAMDQGASLGSTATAANRAAGGLLQGGMLSAANTIGTTAQQVGSPWGNILQGAGQAMQTQEMPRFNAFTGAPL